MAANTAIGYNGASGSCGRMMKECSVTTDAIGLDDREVFGLLQGFAECNLGL